MKLMVFAFNCVTVLLIYIEFARYFLKDRVLAAHYINSYFKSFSDERE